MYTNLKGVFPIEECSAIWYNHNIFFSYAHLPFALLSFYFMLDMITLLFDFLLAILFKGALSAWIIVLLSNFYLEVLI